MPKRATEVPDGPYYVHVEKTWVLVENGKAFLLQEFVVTAGPEIGKHMRVRTPITDVTGTVEL